MNLYLIAQDDNGGYDTYDSAVVAAESEDEARAIHPSTEWDDNGWCCNWVQFDHIDRIAVTLIGTAAKGTKTGTVICASFNAG